MNPRASFTAESLPAPNATSDLGRVAIYTVVCGNYDEPRVGADQTLAVDWHLFTDELPSHGGSEWRAHVIAGNASARLSRSAKIVPPSALDDYDWIIYIDGNMRVVSPTFAEEAIGATPTGLGVWRHPSRWTLYQELNACIAAGKVDPAVGHAQVQHYYDMGYSDTLGLFAGGMLVRRWQSHHVRRFSDRWLAEVEKWTPRDQLSLPFALWQEGLVPSTFDHDLRDGGGLDGAMRRWFGGTQLARRAQSLRSRLRRPPTAESPHEVIATNRWLEMYAHTPPLSE